MAVRLYLLPLEAVDNGDGTNNRGPKYFKWSRDPDPPALIPVTYQLVPYGMEDVCILKADLTGGQHTSLSGQSDVTAIPTNLASTVGAQLTTVQGRLEGYGIPAQWVTAAMTYRQVLRSLIAIFRVSMRFEELGYAQLRPSGVTLSTPWSNMPSPYRDDLLQAIDDLGYDRTGLTASSTLRDLLTKVSTQGIPESLVDT